MTKSPTFRLPERNTRFALPIRHPKTGVHVSAETLYNDACEGMGRVVDSHIGDLIFDNLDYDADPTVCGTDASNAALHDAIYAWADNVHAQLKAFEAPKGLPPIPHASDVEKAIVGRLVTDLLAAGMSITVWNGGDEPELVDSTDAAVIFENLGASDQDELTMQLPQGGAYAGWIRLVWGNDTTVISDYSVRLEPQVAPANKLADDLENGKVKPDGIGRPFQSNTVARFWVCYGSGLVRIKLRKGQELSCSEGGQTDEGFSYTGHCWSFDGERVSYTTQTNARDCDGPISHGAYASCRLVDLQSHMVDGVGFPMWEASRASWQRDYNAEAAGY
jgi:hypothetical protein